MVSLAVPLLAACAVGPDSGDDLALVGDSTIAGKGDGQCATVSANIAPTAPPPFACGPVDSLASSLLADINGFWGSHVGACNCIGDYDGPCRGASSRFELGWIYLEPGFIQRVSSEINTTVGSYALAHELGHELQGHNGVDVDGPLIGLELGADCLAGYYLGGKMCDEGIADRDLQATLDFACSIADGNGDPVHDRNSHGTCDQRMSAIKQGIAAYQQRKAPLAGCRF
ncbi:MAG TPA: neutral zinc metallopeptidase [Kofleriaceae bacterium]|nr:neutral zinc metallopeptidase [Kofleriaceae bacterium]